MTAGRPPPSQGQHDLNKEQHRRQRRRARAKANGRRVNPGAHLSREFLKWPKTIAVMGVSATVGMTVLRCRCFPPRSVHSASNIDLPSLRYTVHCSFRRVLIFFFASLQLTIGREGEREGMSEGGR